MRQLSSCVLFVLLAVAYGRTVEVEEPIIDFVPFEENPHLKPSVPEGTEVIAEEASDPSEVPDAVSPAVDTPQNPDASRPFTPEVVVVETGNRRPFHNPFFHSFLMPFPTFPSVYGADSEEDESEEEDFYANPFFPSFNRRPSYPLFPSMKHLHDDLEEMRRNMFQLFTGFPKLPQNFPSEVEGDQDVIKFHELPTVYNDTKEYNKTDSEGNVINVHEVTRKNVNDGVASFFHLKVFNVLPKDVSHPELSSNSDDNVPQETGERETPNAADDTENEIRDVDAGVKKVPIV